MPYRNGTIPKNKTNWTGEMILFLKQNYLHLTNPQLAKALSLRLTVTRNKMRELGLKRIEMEYWTNEMALFLKNNYTAKGNVELADIFQNQYPKKKKWTKNHFAKKLNYLNLKRTKEQIHSIASKNSSPGGKSFTINKNSSSLNMHPVWIAQQLAWRNKEQQQILIKNPQVIEMGRSIIQLKRTTQQLYDIKQKAKAKGVYVLGLKKTWMKRGAVPNGSVVIWATDSQWPTKWIKINNKYTQYHRYLWLQAGHHIPKGNKITAKPGITDVKTVHDLDCITAAELIIRNNKKASQGLSDNYIAGIISHKNKQLRQHLKTEPQIIQMKRNQLLLQRQILKSQNLNS